MSKAGKRAASSLQWEDTPDEQARGVLGMCDAEALKQQTLGIKNLPHVLMALIGVSAEWYHIGTVFRVDDDLLSGIRRRNRSVHNSLTDMLAEWLPTDHPRHGKPNMKKVIVAIASGIGANNPAEALRVAKEYNDPHPTLFNKDSIDDHILSPDDKPAILEVLKEVSHRWRVIGLMLGIPFRQLQRLEEDYVNLSDRLDNMVTAWLKLRRLEEKDRGFGQPSWRTLAEVAASRVGGRNEQLAKRIAEKHPNVEKRMQPATQHSVKLKMRTPQATGYGSNGAPSGLPLQQRTSIANEQKQLISSAHSPPPCDVLLTMKDLPALQTKLCNVSHKWNKIGVQLNFEPGELERVRQTTEADPVDKLTLLLTRWLQRRAPEPTLETLCQVLEGRVIGEETLAQQLRDERKDFPSALGHCT